MNQRIRQIRELRGLTQEEMGRMISRSAAFVSRAEAGKTKLSDGQIEVLASSLGINELWLTGGEGPMTKNEETRDRRSIGERIRSVRREKQLSQSDFASLLGVSRNTISLLERRKISASPALIRAVVEKMNVDEHWLRNGERTDVTEIEERLSRDREARGKIIGFLKRRYGEEMK